MNYYHVETSNYVEHSGNSTGDENKPIINTGEIHYVSDLPNEQNLFILPGQYENEAKSVRREYIAESSNKAAYDVHNDYLLAEPLMEDSNAPLFSEGLFLEAGDLSNLMEPNMGGDSTVFDMVDEYLNFFDANDDNLSFDPSELMGSDTAVSEQVPVPEKVIIQLKLFFCLCFVDGSPWFVKIQNGMVRYNIIWFLNSDLDRLYGMVCFFKTN